MAISDDALANRVIADSDQRAFALLVERYQSQVRGYLRRLTRDPDLADEQSKGPLIGAALAYLIFNGFRVSTLNFQSFSQVSFGFAVTPDLLRSGIIYALLIGLIGGLLPSIRAARMSVSSALREL